MSTRPTTPSISDANDCAVSNPHNTITVEPRENLDGTSLGNDSATVFRSPQHVPALPDDSNVVNWPPPTTPTTDNVPDNYLKHVKTLGAQTIVLELRNVEKGKHDFQPASNLASRLLAILAASVQTTNVILIFIAVAMICIVPDFIFVVYAYYYSYAEIFFNSQTAIKILRNNGTESAFKFFYWLISGAVAVPNFIIGFGLASLGYKCRKYLKLRYHIFLIWMIPWGAAFLGITSISFWIRPIARNAYQAHVFTHACATAGWDLDIVLAASPSTNTPHSASAVGTASISFTEVPTTQYHLQLIRHLDDADHFDFVPGPIGPDSVYPPFINVTYDWQNQMYLAFGRDNANVSGTYTTHPNLSFPSLNVSLLDDAIPFQRSGHHTCWPSAATLVLQNLTSDYQYNVLQTVTHKPQDVTQMKVCAMAGPEVDQALQITLGVVLINHFYFSSCVVNGGDVW